MKKFNRAQRSACKIKLSVSGPSGSGKSYSSLLLAKGLVNQWNKIAVLDSENGSANLYSDLGEYDVLTLTPPFTIDSYIEGIKLAEQNGYECLIIDSLSHSWEAEGGILQTHANMTGNSFQNWSKLTPLYNKLLQAILQANMHVIVTLRSKQDYVVNVVNGKAVPEKLGLKPIARDGVEYEFSVAFDINLQHQATVSKDRTNLFKNQAGFNLNEAVGKKILNWCNIGSNEAIVDEESFLTTKAQSDNGFSDVIIQCSTLEELHDLIDKYPDQFPKHRELFNNKKNQLFNITKNQLNGQFK